MAKEREQLLILAVCIIFRANVQGKMGNSRVLQLLRDTFDVAASEGTKAEKLEINIYIYEKFAKRHIRDYAWETMGARSFSH